MSTFKKVIITICIVLAPLLYGAHIVNAQSSNTSSQPSSTAPNFNVKLPGFNPGTATVQPITVGDNANKLSRYSIPWIANYINWIYQAMMAAGVVFAVLMIVIGGVQYIMAGASGGVGQAKSNIKNAFIGLTLLIMTYTILAFINPAWTNLGFLSIVMPQLQEQPQTKTCDNSKFSNYFTGKDGKKYCTQDTKLVTPNPKDYGYLQFQGDIKFDATIADKLKKLNSVTIPSYLSKKKDGKELFKDLKIQVTAGLTDVATKTSACNQAVKCAEDKTKICPTPQKAICDSGTNPALFGKSVSVRLVGSGPTYEVETTKYATGTTTYQGKINYKKLQTLECGTTANLCVPDLHEISKTKECSKYISCQYWLHEIMKEAGFKPTAAKTWWEYR